MPMAESRKLKKRPCSACRRWFTPEPRAAHNQKTCSPACRKAWTTGREAKWRGKNPDYQRERRLRACLDRAEQAGAGIEIQPSSHPVAGLPWSLAKTGFEVKMAVLLAFALRLQHAECQTGFRVRIRSGTRSPGRLHDSVKKTVLERAP